MCDNTNYNIHSKFNSISYGILISTIVRAIYKLSEFLLIFEWSTLNILVMCRYCARLYYLGIDKYLPTRKKDYSKRERQPRNLPNTDTANRIVRSPATLLAKHE